MSFPLPLLLGGEVKVESSLEPVEAELAGREVPPGGLSHHLLLLLEVEGRLDPLDRLLGGPEGGRGSGGEVGGLLVGLVEGVHKGVDSSTVGTGGNMSSIGSNSLGSKVGSVLVEPEVPVCGVMGVDEGVGIPLDSLDRFSLIVVIVWLLDYRGSLLDRGSADRSSLDRVSLSEGGGGLSIGTSGDMSTLKDPESILASSVSDSDGLASLVNVAVLSNPLPISGGLLPVHCPVLLGKGSTKPSIPSIEPLLLQDLGLLVVNKLTTGGSKETRCDHKLDHDD